MTRRARRIAVALAVAAVLLARVAAAGPTVNDVSQINPIAVARIAKPTSVEEIQRLVREAKGPISIGGARHSMGGQIATENALFLDMRDFDDVLVLDVEARTIKVQTGITWRKI